MLASPGLSKETGTGRQEDGTDDCLGLHFPCLGAVPPGERNSFVCGKVSRVE